MQAHPLEDTAVKDFALAGKALFTLRNTTTGGRFTFKVVKAKEDKDSPLPVEVWFVKMLTGPDNNTHYEFVGTFQRRRASGQIYFRYSARSRISVNAPTVKAAEWFSKCLDYDRYPSMMEAWHEGRCGRCGRRLTVPESISTGMGPKCAMRAQRAA